MKIFSSIFSLLKRDSNFIKSANYIVTSDYDKSYLDQTKIRRISFFKWVYLACILCAISISFVPLLAGDLITGNKTLLLWLNLIMFIVFSTDYVFRWITYSFRANSHSQYPLLFFPFTGVSIIMLFGILPSFVILFFPLIGASETVEKFISVLSSLVILQLGRLVLLLNVVPPFRLFTNIFVKQRKILSYVFIFLILVTLLFAVIIYRAEFGINDKITSYWDSFYFTVISICTIGYGDIYPVTELGRVMVIVLAFVGVGIFTIPGAVIAGGFLEEIQNKKERKEQFKKEEKEDHKVSIVEKTVFKSIDSVKKVSEKVKTNKKHEPKKDSKKPKTKN